MSAWKTDEYGTRTWQHLGWTILIWGPPSQDPELTGPEGEDVEVDPEGDVKISHGVTDGGNYGTRHTESMYIPFIVLKTFLDVVIETEKLKRNHT